MLTAIEIFCCYAREDQPLLQQLKNHLMPLQRQGLIHIWSDINIEAGDEWEKAIGQHLETAEIILLLISSDFMASEYCYSKEMSRAMQRHEEKTARVIPILLRPTYRKGAPFEKLQFLPKDAKPITDQSWSRDEALYDVVDQIGTIVRELRIKNMIAEAKQLIAENHPEEALAICEQAIIIEPELAPILREKGNALFLLERYVECLEAFDQALQLDPLLADVQFYSVEAQALENLQRYDEALATYDLALQIEPSLSLFLLAKKATLLYRLDRLSEALTIYKKLSSLDTKNALYPEKIGDILLLLQKPQKALGQYEQAIQRNPNANVTRLYEKQGEVLYILGRYKEAVAAIERAIYCKPDDSDLYTKKGRVLFVLKSYEEALEAYQTAINEGSSDPYTHHGKGQALVALGRRKEALEVYEQAIQLASPTPDPQFYHDLGAAHEYLAQQAYKEEREAQTSWEPSARSRLFINPSLARNTQAITQLRTLSGHTERVWRIAFGPDGFLLASASADHTIKLWNPHTGQELRTLSGHIGDVINVAFSPDGLLLASASDDYTIKLWNPHTGQELRTLSSHTDVVWGIAFSSDGLLLASTSTDNTIKLWNPHTGQELRTLSGHTERVWRIAFSPDGFLLASASADHTIKLWNPHTGQELRTLSGHIGDVINVAFSPDGLLLASASDDYTIKLWNPHTGQELRTLSGHTDAVNSVAFSPDGLLLASASDDHTIIVWGNESYDSPTSQGV